MEEKNLENRKDIVSYSLTDTILTLLYQLWVRMHTSLLKHH